MPLSLMASDARPRQVKAKFSREEDELIRQAMEQGEPQSWGMIANQIPNRTARQVRERWVNYLNPRVNTEPWTIAEEDNLRCLHAQFGSQWSKMVPFFANRTDIALKNHFQLIQRRLRKNRFRIPANRQSQLLCSSQATDVFDSFPSVMDDPDKIEFHDSGTESPVIQMCDYSTELGFEEAGTFWGSLSFRLEWD
jgi:hypothetical protein